MAQREAFKRAKNILQIEDSLKFEAAQPGCGRVISFESHPDFFCDYAISRSDRQEAITDVLKWYLGGIDNRAHSGVDFLNRIFGGGVRET